MTEPGQPDIFQWTKEYYLTKPTYQLFAFEETTSTNDQAKERFHHKHPCIFLARKQTAGRGQFERKWLTAEDPKGTLLISYAYLVKNPPQPTLTPQLGAALKQSIEEIWRITALRIKAPNDLYLHDRKIAGFLTETVSQAARHQLIIGLGLNLYSYPATVPEAGCLFSHDDSGQLSKTAWSLFLTQWDQKRTSLIDSLFN